MKPSSKLFILLCLLISMVTMAQNKPGLTISSEYPEAGSNYWFTYNPKGSALDGIDSISITLYYFVDADKNVSKIGLSPKKIDGVWKEQLAIPANAKAFYISLKNKKGDLVDNNNGNGYPYFIYKNNLPVSGSKAFIATLYVFENQNAGTFKNIEKAETLLGQEFQTNPESRKIFAQTNYNVLLNSGDDGKKALLIKTLYDSLNTDDEKNYQLARNFFYQLKKNKTVDSITAAAKTKFPQGDMARADEVQAIYKLTTAAEKEKAYDAWILKFPLNKFKNNTILNDYALNDIAVTYAKEKNYKKALSFKDKFITAPWKGEAWAGIAIQLMKDDTELNEALELFKNAAANSLAFKTSRKNEDGADFAAYGYGSYNNYIAQILYKQKKYKEALPYVDNAYKSYTEPKGYINNNYAEILVALGRHREAFDKIDELVKTGQTSKEMLDKLKDLYVKKYGSDKGYNEYLAEANKQMADKIIKDLPRKIINVPAKGFTLKDVDGNTVSLADYKGKIVVLDFWATWCGPCKASFPAMQMAQKKYKDDPNVKFLFIHTWERGESAENPAAAAKKYIVDNHYNFEVLIDAKDPETGINKVVDSYGITGIPTKFIIDKNGNIRFRLTGFSGGNDAAVQEVAAMITLAGKG